MELIQAAALLSEAMETMNISTVEESNKHQAAARTESIRALGALGKLVSKYGALC